jgi:hypothetical protein
MKVAKSSILIVLISILAISIYGTNVEGANWKPYGDKYSKTTDYRYFYDKDSVVYPTKGIVRVWARHMITEEAFKKLLREKEAAKERWEAEKEIRKAEEAIRDGEIEREKAKLRKKGDFKALRELELLEAVKKVSGQLQWVGTEVETTMLLEINCKERVFRVLECQWCTEDKDYRECHWLDISPTVTVNFSKFPSSWYNIPVDVPIEALYEAVCRRSIFSW